MVERKFTLRQGPVMAGFDPDVFGGSNSFDPEVFTVSAVKPSPKVGGTASQIANDAISQGARSFAGQGSEALGGVSQAVLNLLGGAVRGAGSIGATLARPFESGQENDQRRAGIDANMQAIGAQPDSFMYGAGKLGSEIAGTLPIGGIIGKGVGAMSPALAPLAASISSGGMRTGATLPMAQNLTTRALGGAVSGGAMAGAINPDDAGTGALLGGALPLGVSAAGMTGRAIGSLLPKGMQANARTLDTARQSIDAGYVIPPNMVNPSLTNQVIESISGKQATQQIASTRNAAVTEGLVKKALGIPKDTQLTQSTLENLRATAGKAYADVSNISSEAAADLEALKQARNDASAWFKSYNRSASPVDLAKAKEYRATADNLENLLEFHAASAGRDDLIPALRDARTQIAKTYTVGRALNDASGTVDARVLGRMYEKGMPLSDGLDVAGQFASAFPTIAKSAQQIGSPAAHNLKALASMGLGLGGHATFGPFGLASAALPFIAPPMARAAMFSKSAQRGLLDAAMQGDEQALGLLTGASRALPVVGASLLGP
jgi:hypothetical protein